MPLPRLEQQAARAGLSVSELKAEITVETAMVRANWRKNWPVMPLMKAHGTNTADSTRATAITGPDTCSIALWAACRGVRPCFDVVLHGLDDDDGVVHDDADGQHQAEQRQVVQQKPMAAMTAKVPTMATGTAISGISAERQFCRNTSTTTATRTMASTSVRKTSLIDSAMNGVVSKAIL